MDIKIWNVSKPSKFWGIEIIFQEWFINSINQNMVGFLYELLTPAKLEQKDGEGKKMGFFLILHEMAITLISDVSMCYVLLYVLCYR